MPTIKKLMLNGVAYKFKTSPIPIGEGILQENGMETWLENGNYIDFEVPTPTNLVGVAGTLKATLTWTSATGESGVTWTEEKLVRKEGSAPQGSMDGTTVATITTKDTYSSTGYEDTGLDSTKTYYYKVFAVYDNGTERGSTDVNVTPEPYIPSPAGIYHSATLGLITLSDGNGNEVTISDKNLGATQVFNQGNAYTDANSGKLYQWGNNYGFPRTGNINIATSQVNASSYGPNNYYSSDVFIARDDSVWDSSNNSNLWGGITGTVLSRRGPCDAGYHIPSKTELENIITIMTSLGLNIGDPMSIEKYLKLPHSGIRYFRSGNITTDVAIIWSSDAYQNNTAWSLGEEYMGMIISDSAKPTGGSIRPFKNEAVQPDNTWTKIYPVPAPTLLSYEELLALGNSGLNAIVPELNKYPDDYYNKLKAEGHLTEWHTDTRYIKSQSYRPVSIEGYGVGYNSGSWAALII